MKPRNHYLIKGGEIVPGHTVACLLSHKPFIEVTVIAVLNSWPASALLPRVTRCLAWSWMAGRTAEVSFYGDHTYTVFK